MRVITGSAKGATLKNFDIKTHPLSDRAKSALFSIINEKIEKSRILDLYAGSGALGIECLSRGADHATFVDISDKSFRSINENLQKTKLQDKSDVIKSNVEIYIKKMVSDKFDIVFVCPPYDKINFGVVKAAQELVDDGGILIFEHNKKDRFRQLEHLTKIDDREYGIVKFEIYQSQLSIAI